MLASSFSEERGTKSVGTLHENNLRESWRPWITMGNSESVAGGQTAVPAKETYVWYRKFMREYPSGLQTLHEFKTLLGLQGLNPKASQHVDQVYNTFDMNKVRPLVFIWLWFCILPF